VTDLLKKIDNICERATGNIYDIYYVLYTECILNQDNPSFMLQNILIKTQRQEFNEDGQSEFFKEFDVEEIRASYFDLLQQYVFVIIRENLEESAFYKKLYEGVFKSGIFPQELDIQVILLYFLGEEIRGIPYFQPVNLLEMTGEDYKKAIQCLEPQIERMIDILNRRFKSRTEEASQIYEVISTVENREDKIVLLSVLINIVQRNTIVSMKEEEEDREIGRY
jgi:hypothetical protein